MLKTIRILLAAVTFILLTASFIGLGGRLQFLAKWQLVPAILAVNLTVLAVLALVTLLLGRVYCAVFCPLGIFQDIVLWIRRKAGRKDFAYERPWTKTRWAVLAVCVIAAACGFLALPALVDPYSLYGRIASELFQPAAAALSNAVAAVADWAGHPLVLKTEVFVKSGLALAVAAASFVVIAFLAAWDGRFYCNAVCPAGTILSAFSHKTLLRLKIDTGKCVGCGMCTRECKARCIDFKNHTVDNARCVRCFNCVKACKKGAIKL